MWNFSTNSTTKLTLPTLFKTIYGSIYFNNPSFHDTVLLSSMPNGLQQLQQTLKNHLNTAKWNRWLYRYSLMHRRTLKNAHKLTVTKRLIQSGFYDNKLSLRNPWVNHRSTKLKKALTTHLNVLFYSDFFAPATINSWQRLVSPVDSKSDSFLKTSNFSHYETSFFWVLKRFYLFNTISTNVLKSSLLLKQQPINNNLNYINLPTQYIDLMKLTSLYLPSFSEFNFNEVKLNKKHAINLQKSSLYYSKDLTLAFGESDIFSLETLDTLYWVLSPISKTNQKPLLFFIDFTLNNHKTLIKPYNWVQKSSLKELTFGMHTSSKINNSTAVDVINWSYFF